MTQHHSLRVSQLVLSVFILLDSLGTAFKYNELPLALAPDDVVHQRIRRSVAALRDAMGPMGAIRATPQAAAGQMGTFRYSDDDVKEIQKLLSFGHSHTLGPLSMTYQEAASAEAAGFRNAYSRAESTENIIGGGQRLYGRVRLPIAVQSFGADNADITARQLFNDWCSSNVDNEPESHNFSKASMLHIFSQHLGGDPVADEEFCTGTNTARNFLQRVTPTPAQLPMACSRRAVDLVMQNTPGFVDRFAICVLGGNSAEFLGLWVNTAPDKKHEVAELRIKTPTLFSNHPSLGTMEDARLELTYHLNNRLLTSTIAAARRDLWRHFRLDHGKPGTRLGIEELDISFVANVTAAPFGFHPFPALCHLSAHNFQLVMNATSPAAKPNIASAIIIDVEDVSHVRARPDGRCLEFRVHSKGGHAGNWSLCTEEMGLVRECASNLEALKEIFTVVDFGAT